jgi:hypothetical protein
MVTSKEFEAAKRRGERFAEKNPRAVEAHYDRPSNMIDVALSSGAHFRFSPQDAQGLEHATPAKLKMIEVSASGYGIHFPRLDADFYLPALLEGLFGTRKWMAARMGQAGGKARTVAKRAASRANGRLGGRPKKKSA